MSFGKAKIKLYAEEDAKKTTFADVAGCEEAKEELQEIIEFLKYPQKFQKLGGKIRKVFYLLDLQEPEKHFWQKPLQVNQECLSSQ